MGFSQFTETWHVCAPYPQENSPTFIQSGMSYCKVPQGWVHSSLNQIPSASCSLEDTDGEVEAGGIPYQVASRPDLGTVSPAASGLEGVGDWRGVHDQWP